MQFIGCLTRFQQPAADVQSVSLRAALESVVLDLQCTLETAQIQVLFSRPENDPTIKISPARLRQMLFYVLQAAQGCSSPGDLVRIEIQQQAGYVVLWVEQCRSEREQAEPHISFPVSETVVERALVLADTIVRNAGGQFRVTTNPLLVVADFPSGSETASAVDETVEQNRVSEVAGTRLAV
jgi:C4-dicarboxylate-specific signal transduction histidine kinase